MENPIDKTIDLGLVNYIRHPENADYVVFRFVDENRANHFEETLNDQTIWFEREQDQIKTRTVHLFAIHKNDYKKVTQINFLTEAQFRTPMIPTKGLRYGLIIVTLTLIVISIIGFCKNQRLLDEANRNLNTENRGVPLNVLKPAKSLITKSINAIILISKENINIKLLK